MLQRPMAANHLEQLLAEWYEFQGYFLRRNVLVGKRPKGGYEGELDVVAFHPAKRHLVHIETSLDADSWEQRDKRFSRKFALGREHIPSLFTGLDLPADIDQQAVLVFASNINHATVGGARLVTVPEVLRDVLGTLKDRSVAKNAVPEHLPILRTLQFVSHYRRAVFDVLFTK